MNLKFRISRKVTLFLFLLAAMLFHIPLASAQDTTPDLTALQTQLEQARQEWLTLRSDSTASADSVQAAWTKFRDAQNALRQANGVAGTTGPGQGNGSKLRTRDGSSNGQPQRRRLRDGSNLGTDTTTLPAGTLSAPAATTCDGTGTSQGRGRGQGGGRGRGRRGGR